MIRIQQLEKNFGPQLLFQDVNLNINKNEKVGLIGRNGSGKSTFLKMLLGQEEYTSGNIQISKNLLIRSLEQNLNFTEATLLEQVASALPKQAIGEEWKAKSILLGLGFQNTDFERSPFEFSSGFQIRIRLAEALVSDCHLLVLDEPTNYLDITSLRWLTKFLKNWSEGLILVTHNHNFMEDIVTHTISIHRKKMRKLKGGPQKILDLTLQNEEIHEKTRLNQLKKKAKTEQFIRTFRAGARSAGLVQSRIKSLDKQEIHEKLQKIQKIQFKFQYTPFKGNILLQCEDLCFHYQEDSPLITDFNINMLPGDKIAIIGPNGKGKSTLLKLLIDKLKPNSGKITKHGQLQIGYFSSDSKDQLDTHKSIFEELLSINNVNEQRIRSVCAALLFKGDDIKKKIGDLSGGEKSRVALAKVMLFNSQVLVLDEPTNHLDMESCEALTTALQDYEGTVIFVTHDEGIISQLANRLVVFDNGNAKVKDRSYQEFLSTEGWSNETQDFFKVSKSRGKNHNQAKKDRHKLLRKNRKEQAKLERLITKLSQEQESLGTQLSDACFNKNHAQIKTLGEQTKALTDQLDQAYENLERLIGEEEKLMVNN